MKSPVLGVPVRFGFAALLGAVLLLPASCGTGGAGGHRSVAGLGGAVRPNEKAYALTPTSDAVAATDRPAGLAATVDLRRRGLVPPVQDQRWNSCIAWTLGYYVMTGVWAQALRSHGNGSYLDLTKSQNWFSPDYIYSQRDTAEDRLLAAPDKPICFESDGEVGCMRPEQALWLLVSKGCARWGWMCGEDTDGVYRSCDPADGVDPQLSSRAPWQLADFGAEQFKPRCFVRFGNLDTLRADTRGQMKAWLHEQSTPIAIVVKMMSGWVTYGGENKAEVAVNECGATETRGVCLDVTGEDLGGQHMMTVIGYDDNFPSPEQYPDLPAEKRGSFLIVNQWGDKWGDEGYMWVPYSELAKIWVGGYGIIGRDLDHPEGGGGGECVQDPISGAYNVLFEPDDVPENLDAEGEVIESTAVPLDDCGGACPADSVGSKSGEERVDSADWYVFDVAGETGAQIQLNLGPNPPSELRVVITDEEFRRVGKSDYGYWFGRLCSPGRYYVKIYPSNEFIPTPTGLPYTLEFTQTPGGPLSDDEICGAVPMPGGSATGTVRLDLSPTYTFDFVDWIDYWKYEVPTTGELALVLSASDTGHSDDVAIVTFEGETAEAALPVAWTTPKIRRDYIPQGPNRPGILQLGRRVAGETLYFGLVHYAWSLDKFNQDLNYKFDIVTPEECPEDCVETPKGVWPQPAADQNKKWQLLRSWEYEGRSGTSYYTFPFNGRREVRVSVKPTPGADCPAGTELRLVATVQEPFGEVRIASSRTVPADVGGELTLEVPGLPRVLNAAGSTGGYVPYSAVHVHIHDPQADRGDGSCGQYEVRIEEWGLGAGVALEFTPWGPESDPGHRWFLRCFDPPYPPGLPPGVPSPYQANGLQFDEFGNYVPAEEVPCANIRNVDPIYLLNPYFDHENEWILGSANQWNQPWYTWQRGFVAGPIAPIGRHLILGVANACDDFTLSMKGQNGLDPADVSLDVIGGTSGVSFHRLSLPPTQEDGISQQIPYTGGVGPSDYWVGLRDPGDRPLDNYTIKFWDEVTLTSWLEEWHEPDDFLTSDYGSPTTAHPLTLGGAGPLSLADSVDQANGYDFYSLDVTQDGNVLVNLTDVCLPYGAGAGASEICSPQHADVHVWDPLASQWTTGAQQPGSPDQLVTLANVPAGTTLMILVARARGAVHAGYSRVTYTLEVSSP